MDNPNPKAAASQELVDIQRAMRRSITLERELWYYHDAAQRQLVRVRALADFALQARATLSQREIAGMAIDHLLGLFVLDQGCFYRAQDDRSVRIVVARARPGMAGRSDSSLATREPLSIVASAVGSKPLIFAEADPPAALARIVDDVAALFDGVEQPAEALLVVIPVTSPVLGFIGIVVARAHNVHIRSVHDPLPGEMDEPHLSLLASHVSSALENALLYETVRRDAAELEVRVSERTSELAVANAELDARLQELRETQDQLLHAGKMAAVGTLAAGLSHELNNPMSVILGYAQCMLRAGGHSEVDRKALEAIVRHARRCATLVDALLDFSRKRTSAREHVELDSLLSRVLDLAQVNAARRQVHLQPGWARDIGTAWVSAAELESALLNVVNNAVDASHTGGVVEIDGRRQRSSGRDGVVFIVTDRGVGMGSEVRSRIFDPFFTTKPTGKGTGLGLALTQKIVESHDGRIDVDTQPGRGTSIKLWIPGDGTGSSSSLQKPVSKG